MSDPTHPTPPDPEGFEDGDEIDSAAIVEPDDGYRPPADPEAEPVDEDTAGGDV